MQRSPILLIDNNSQDNALLDHPIPLYLKKNSDIIHLDVKNNLLKYVEVLKWEIV